MRGVVLTARRCRHEHLGDGHTGRPKHDPDHRAADAPGPLVVLALPTLSIDAVKIKRSALPMVTVRPVRHGTRAGHPSSRMAERRGPDRDTDAELAASLTAPSDADESGWI
jgi:hypothetical protein